MSIKSVFLIVLLLVILGTIGLILGSGGITGASVAKSVSCYKDNDCDDKITATEDICKNPGTEYSICVNKAKN